jgi:hypothetical protein
LASPVPVKNERAGFADGSTITSRERYSKELEDERLILVDSQMTTYHLRMVCHQADSRLMTGERLRCGTLHCFTYANMVFGTESNL